LTVTGALSGEMYAINFRFLNLLGTFVPGLA